MMKLFQKQGWNLVNDSLVLDTGDQTDSRALITGLTASLEKEGQQRLMALREQRASTTKESPSRSLIAMYILLREEAAT